MPFVETYDGLEREPAPASVPCAGCGREVVFDLWAFTDHATAGWALSDAEAAAEGLVRTTERGWVSTLVSPGGPAAFVGPLTCPDCRTITRVVVGLHEFQPARWCGGVVRPG